MKKTTNRIISLLVVVFLVCGLFPAAFAAPDDLEVSESGITVTELPDTEYNEEQPPVSYTYPEDIEHTEYPDENGFAAGLEGNSDPNMIPFEMFADPDAVFYPYEDYLAIEGEFAVAMSELRGADNEQIGTSTGWLKATLTSPDTQAQTVTRDLYLSRVESYGSEGFMLLDGLAAGKYMITIAGTTVQQRLCVLDSNEKQFIHAEGLYSYGGITYANNSQLGYSWVAQALSDGYVNNIRTFFNNNYFLHSDGYIYISVYGVNVGADDIDDATLTANSVTFAELVSIIPGPVPLGDGKLTSHILKFEVTGQMPGEFSYATQLNLTCADGVTNNISWTGHRGVGAAFYLDISRIDELKLGIVPVNYSGDLPDKLSVEVFSGYSQSMGTVLYTAAPELADGKYTIDLDSKMYHFAMNSSMGVSFSFGTGPMVYEANFYPPNTLSTYFDISIGYDVIQIPTAIDGLGMRTYSGSGGSSPYAYWENPLFTIVGADFNPVPGVTIARDTVRTTAYNDYYVVSADSPLTDGATYYLMFGGMPWRKLIADSTLNPTGSGSGAAKGSISMNNTVYYGDSLSIYVDFGTSGKITLSEFSVRLTNLLTKDVTTLSSANGNLQAHIYDTYASFYSTASIASGVYSVEYYKSGKNLTDADYSNISYSRYIVVLAAGSGFSVRGAGTSTYTVNGISDFVFLVNCNTTPGAKVSGLEIAFYKKTATFIESSPVKTAMFAEVTAGTNGNATSTISMATLGIDPGGYWCAVSDSQGRVLYSGYHTFSKAALTPDTGLVSLSGMVTLRDAAANGVAVELWQNDTLVEKTTTSASGLFNFDDLTKGTYQLKIPKGSSWKAFEETYTMSATRQVQITLESDVPSYTVSGTVTLDGAPLAGCVVSIYDKTAPSVVTATAASGEDGMFEFTLIDGTYIIKISQSADHKAFESGDIVVSGADVTGKDVTLVSRPYIEGTVTLDGVPQSAVYVYLYKDDAYVRSTSSASDGKFVFRGLDENTTYTVRVDFNDYKGLSTGETSTGGKTTVDVTLAQLVTLNGKVTFKGAAVPNIYVKLEVPGQNYPSYAYTNGNGEYAFTRLEQMAGCILTVDAGLEYGSYRSEEIDMTTGLTGGVKTVDIVLQERETHTVEFKVEGKDADEPLVIYIYGGSPYVNITVVEESGVFSAKLPNGSYNYYYYYSDTYGNGSITVSDEDVTVDVILPAIYVISGAVTDTESNPVPGAVVNASGAFYQSTTTDKDGKYALKTKLTSGTVQISARHETKGYGSIEAVTLSAANSEDNDITLATNIVTFTVTDASTESVIPNATVYIGSQTGKTDADGNAVFYNVATGEQYYSVYAAGYYSKYNTSEIVVGDQNNIDVELTFDVSSGYNFSLKISDSEITSGGTISLTPILEYRGTGTPVSGGKLKLNLPSGMTVSSPAHDDAGYDVIFGADGKAALPSVRLTVGENVSNLSELLIQGNFTGGDVNKDAYGHVTVVNATLNAPSIAKADELFNVFGTAPSGSAVAIKADGVTLKVVNVQNRYFHTTISIPTAGVYELQAVAVKNDASYSSLATDITITDDEPPSVINIDFTSGYLGSKPVVNPEYGFPTFSTWVLERNYSPYIGQYRGIYNIEGSFEIINAEGYEFKSLTFTDWNSNNHTADLNNEGNKYSFSMKEDEWGGLGTVPIIATLTKDGVDYTFTIALVTILIDPSGYVYDSLTEERIVGATVTLEVKQGGVWVKWTDPDGLQANPQITDDEGRYGWGVPVGEYRVRVSADDYTDAIANNYDNVTGLADGTYIQSDEGFPVPPEQTEVNIPMVYTKAPEVTAEYDEGKLVFTFTRPMPASLKDSAEFDIIVKADGEPVDGTWSLSSDGTELTFEPTVPFEKDQVVTVELNPALQSGDGIALGAVSIEPITITDDDDDDDDDDNGGGSYPLPISGGGGSSTKDDDKDNGDKDSEETPDAQQYSDVDADAWYYDAVRYVTENKLMQGTGDGKFSPETQMTRAMLVTVLYRLEGEPQTSGTTKFGDVEAGQWYTDAVDWASSNGIVNGYDGSQFGVNDNITREQIVTILYRYAQKKSIDISATTSLSSYADTGEISEYALEAMKWANAIKLMLGRTDTTLVPQGYATRAEVAALLMRFIENVL